YWLMCGAGPDGSGRWNFRLESFDGQVRIDAEDEEPGAHADHLALLALVLGLEAIDQPADVLVLTPNRYIWQGLSEGLDEWRENGWQWDSFGGLVPIKYLDLWQRVERLRNIHDVSCRAIPSAQIANVTTFVPDEPIELEQPRVARRIRRIHLPSTGDWPSAAPRRRKSASRERQVV
ncbi:MAG: hypothetical protein SGJ19_00880, partial [Planctomycetia bacterium]|nr:hypothetical protein [Planctomycetia bacterium]